MTSKVDIANICLEILGKPSIASLTDNSNAARAVNSTYDLERRARLTGPATWRFSIARTSLPALAAAPVSGPYSQMFALPPDCLRVILAGDIWPGLDLSDYKLGPTDAAYSVKVATSCATTARRSHSSTSRTSRTPRSLTLGSWSTWAPASPI
jgi:hypothetical protein